jgi:hypothetical protein
MSHTSFLSVQEPSENAFALVDGLTFGNGADSTNAVAAAICKPCTAGSVQALGAVDLYGTRVWSKAAKGRE